MEPIDTDAQVYQPSVDIEALKRIARELLVAIGENPDREGIADTPRRWANWWKEFIEYDPGKVETVFESVQSDQMIVVSGIRVYSLCEHHLLPFYCDVVVGYISDDKILGLSKFARIAQKHAHRLQVQERLTRGIAREVSQLAQTPSVAVLSKGEHLCTLMRGVRQGSVMTSSYLGGSFRDDPKVRAEFFSIAHGTEPRWSA